jgi:hypothetical protein
MPVNTTERNLAVVEFSLLRVRLLQIETVDDKFAV